MDLPLDLPHSLDVLLRQIGIDRIGQPADQQILRNRSITLLCVASSSASNASNLGIAVMANSFSPFTYRNLKIQGNIWTFRMLPMGMEGSAWQLTPSRGADR